MDGYLWRTAVELAHVFGVCVEPEDPRAVLRPAGLLDAIRDEVASCRRTGIRRSDCDLHIGQQRVAIPGQKTVLGKDDLEVDVGRGEFSPLGRDPAAGSVWANGELDLQVLALFRGDQQRELFAEWPRVVEPPAVAVGLAADDGVVGVGKIASVLCAWETGWCTTGRRG